MISFLFILSYPIEIEKASLVSFIIEEKGKSTISMPHNLITAVLLKCYSGVKIDIYAPNMTTPIIKSFCQDAIILKQTAIIENLKNEDLNVTLWTLSSDICSDNNLYIYSPSYIKATFGLEKSNTPLCIFGGFVSNIKISLDLSALSNRAKATLYRSSDLASLSNAFNCERMCEFRSKYPFVLSIYSKSDFKQNVKIQYQGNSPKVLNKSCKIDLVPVIINNKIVGETKLSDYNLNKCKNFVLFDEDSIFTQVILVVIIFVFLVISLTCLVSNGIIKLPEPAKAEEKEGLIKRSV